MKLKLYLFVLALFYLNIIHTQNYLYQKDMSGLSGYVNVLTQAKLDDSPGFSFGADYTFDGTASLGVKRTQLKSKNIFDDSDTGYYTFNFSVTPLKLKKGKTTYSIPLVAELNLYNKEQFFSYGIRFAAYNEFGNNSFFLPVVSVLNQPSFTDLGQKYVNVVFEANLMFQYFKIAPLVSVSEGKVRFGLSLGFAWFYKSEDE